MYKMPSMSLRSEEHTSELQSPSVISYAVFCLKKKRTRPSICLPLHHTSDSRGWSSTNAAETRSPLSSTTIIFFFSNRPPPRSTQLRTLFPYTTLFRSRDVVRRSAPLDFVRLEERGLERTGCDEIGRAHVRTPVTLSYLVCRLLLEKKKKITTSPSLSLSSINNKTIINIETLM